MHAKRRDDHAEKVGSINTGKDNRISSEKKQCLPNSICTKKSRFGREIKTVYPFCFSKNNANNIFASETKKIATVKNEETIKCKNKVPH